MQTAKPMSRVVFVLCASLACAATAGAQERWSIDPKPVLILGAAADDTTDVFAQVLSATRLANGNVIVADRPGIAMREFSMDGKLVAQFGAVGSGPGEFQYLAAFFRCGDSLVTQDISEERTSVFTTAGRFVRSFRFETMQADAQSPYYTACGPTGVFAHYGWDYRAPEMRKKYGRSMAFRDTVPMWLSDRQGHATIRLGTAPGSDRYLVVGDSGFGTRPLPLGRETQIAVGADRVYVGAATTYDIDVFDFKGKRIGRLAKPNVSLEVTKADILSAKAKDMVGWGPGWRATIEHDYAQLPFPKQFPAYRRIIIDADGLVWVQDYPRAASSTVTWTVFSRAGAMVQELSLPSDLDVFEVGRDYVLGRYLDPNASIPEVRLYRLNR